MSTQHENTSPDIPGRPLAGINPRAVIAVVVRIVVAAIRAVAVLALIEQFILRAPLGAIDNAFFVAVGVTFAAVWAVTEVPRVLTRRHVPAGQSMAIVYDLTYFGVWAAAVFSGMTIPGVGTVLLGYLALALMGYRLVAGLLLSAFKAWHLLPSTIAVASLLIAHAPSGPVPAIDMYAVVICVMFGMAVAIIPTLGAVLRRQLRLTQ
ncbi:hypothetical protein [Actinomyces sp.]|uniref:hypothetical protein n=1 Tax=Actinomyces sp. TaxID=29317 RepID=UPI0026DA78F5|nr:hypothetical protein [Actinomyces sp.]MDO4900842.1 hypothetical protein [Actinomyces sp.]